MLLIKLNIIPAANISYQPKEFVDGVIVASLIGLVAVISMVRYLFYSINALEETEQKLSLERDLLEYRVQERTAHLQTALKHKDAFLATMSHELRTPLNIILNRSQALQLGIYGPLTNKMERSLAGIHSSGKHLLSLINEILDLSKIEAGAMEIQFEAVNLSAVIEDINTAFLPLAKQKDLQFNIRENHFVETITADPKRIRQILFNLLSNAIKFTPENESIGLIIDQSNQNKSIRFTIWDKGIGISPEDQQKLFAPFSQIDNKLSRQYEGTGLGLTIVEKLVELHSGDIKLISQPKLGSKFIVTLPINPPPLETT